MSHPHHPVVILAATPACAKAAREVLEVSGIGSDVAVVETGVAPRERGPVLLLAESADDLSHDELVAAADRDFLLLSDVSQLALRVTLLHERSARRYARTVSAESLRSETMRLTWAVHRAESVPALAETVTKGLRRVFGARDAAVVLPESPTRDDASTPALSWTASVGATPRLAELIAPQLPPNPFDQRAVDWASAPLDNHTRVVSLTREQEPELIAELFGPDVERVEIVPVDCDDSLQGALLIADGLAPERRTEYERRLFAYLGIQVSRAVSELWLREREGQAQTQLRETSAELQRLVDEMDELGVVIRSIANAVNVGVLFYDNENRPKLHNRMVEELLGLTGFDPKTGRSTHVYASDRRTRVKQDKNIISETLEGDTRGLIYWVGDPDGEQRAVVTEAHIISRPGGERLGSAVVTYDVTDLANAIEIREEYLATVSHELRTPLTSIVGYLDLIDDGHDVDALGFGREFRTIQRSAEQMLALIRDLLSTSSRELVLRIEPTDVSALLAQSVSAFRPTLDHAHQRLRLETPSGSLLAHVDSGRLKQVVDNLISNAAKYTPDGGTIAVGLERDAESLVIVVSDDGRGISKTDQARLFDRFFRTREVRESAIQGVGIGLTIVKTIIDAHGGTIDVSSEPGRGSTFTVRLPLRPLATPLATLPMEP